MTTADPVGDLLLRWEDARRRGAAVTLEDLCRDCPEYLAELRTRVAALESMSELLGTNESRTLIGPPSSATTAGNAATAGRYQPVRPHARGGLGEVLLAEDGELRRPVALKRILAPYADSPLARRRFVREAEITARLQHPGIVPVYGLTTGADGRPCYAMRFVEGESLADALARFHGAAGADFASFDFRHLLQPFVAACNAVAYAHSRGVVHRDLKPANIMLGPFGETLVVDWGLAKEYQAPSAVTDSERTVTYGGTEPSATLRPGPPAESDDATQPGSVVGTPAYMAPEQARGDDAGPAADVFSLGATLYAVLTGKSPFQGPSAPAALEKARNADFPPPRRVKPGVPAALDAVCRKAMARDPGARYATALDLAADVERWLADEPVTARRDPWRDRLRRWVKRHRTVVAGLAALAAAAVVGLIVVGVREAAAGRRIAAERDAALTARLRTRQALDDMTSPVALAGMRAQQKVMPEQAAFLARALAYYQEFAAESASDAAGRRLLADAKYRVAAMLQLLGRGDEAEVEYRAAADLYERLAAEKPGETAYRERQADAFAELADALADREGRLGDAEADYRRAVVLREALAAARPHDAAAARRLAQTRRGLAALLRRNGRRADAVIEYRKALTAAEAITAQPGATAEDRAELANALSGLSAVLGDEGRRAEADPFLARAADLYVRLAADHPGRPEYRHLLANAHHARGYGLNWLGRQAEAEAAYKQALAVSEPLAAEYPVVEAYRKTVATTLTSLANMQWDLGRRNDALAVLRRAVRTTDELAAANPESVELLRDAARARGNLALRLTSVGQFREAESAIAVSLAGLERAARDRPDDALANTDLATALTYRGQLAQASGEADGVLDWYDRAVRTLDGVLARDPKHAQARYRLGLAHMRRAEALDKLGRHRDAAADWLRAVDGVGPGLKPTFLAGRALSLAKAGDWAAAVAAADEASAAPRAKADTFRYCAAALAQASAAASGGGDELAARAVKLLRRAGRDAAVATTDPDFAPLRERDDFRRLMAELKAPAP